ncbi:T9SS type A sorting domain-containing protein [Ulvibacter antarcticus]|uniref:Putative secreted protein (Por secretion system target) n=1 Tax=Ulvibacter antarcticus TaxID=442714 RepID=A0A3L9Z2M4_9FLAO|nr:T9SS type A sorting domain-containing protein [Ulvibacter antarcticus]RMA64598.1 putative secreted protein (Por secretion system target) [Ulvibacter antarcticus]
MKNQLLVFLMLISIVSSAQIVNIPDPNFKAAILESNVDLNADGEIQVSEAENAGVIIANSRNISDITGIEAFVNISRLYLSFNNLTTVDFTNNPILEELLIEYNQLETLNISNNDQLRRLWFTGNSISELDLSNNPNIEILWGSNNELVELDVTQIPSLASLSMGNNQLSTIDVTQNPILSNIDLVAGNSFTEFDFSQNPLLCSVTVGSNNFLEYINLKNGGNTLLVEGNTCYWGSGHSNTILLATNNPILESICVDDITFAENNFAHIPPQTVFVDCLLEITDFETSSISIYPNPASDYFTIEANAKINSIEIVNVLGQTLFSEKTNNSEETIDISSLSAGAYFVMITADNITGVFQVIKK